MAPLVSARRVRLGVLVAFFALLCACRSEPEPIPARTTLVVAQGGDPGALNPAVTTSGNTHPVTDQIIFNGLIGTWHDGAPFTGDDRKV